jgi:peptide/nickel transport system permease protein
MLFGITLIIFVLANLMPGDAVTAMMAAEAPVSMADLRQMRSNIGLDKPLPLRYLIWLGELLRGNLGYSFISFEPVGRLIAQRLWPTLELMGGSLLISTIIGVAFGIFSAVRQYSFLDYLLTVLGFLGRSVPVFFVGMLFIYLFALKIPLFPVSGMSTAGRGSSLADNLLHIALPLASLSILRIAEFLRYSRASMLEVLGADFIWTARSKGLKEGRIIMRHAFRNALIPLVTLLGLNIPVLFGGAIIIEQVFQWPGMGVLFITAVNQRDYPLLMGLSLISSVIVLASNLATDLAYALVDPRIHYE